MVSRSRTYDPGYGDLSFCGAEFKEVKCLRILRVWDLFEWSSVERSHIETYLSEAVSKAARNLCVVRRAGKLFDCKRVVKSYFNAYVSSSLKYCALLWMSSANSHLGLLDRAGRSA